MNAVKQILADIQKLTVEPGIKANMRQRVLQSAVALKLITEEEAAKLGK